MTRLAILAAALTLGACTTDQAATHVQSAGATLCEHRGEIKAATDVVLDPRPTWLDRAQASLDAVCMWMGWI